MHVSGAPLVLFSCFQCVGYGVELSMIKAMLPLKKEYAGPYHREILYIVPILGKVQQLFRCFLGRFFQDMKKVSKWAN